MAKTMNPTYFVAWRKRMGLTQAQFAAKSGDHLVTVKRWETGARKLPPHIGWIMAAIENGLEPVGKEAMFEVEDSREPTRPNPKIPLPGKEKQFGYADWIYTDDQPSPVEKKPETDPEDD
ncbi:hypothetical protein G6L68_25390 [Agrobacterium fabrum]|uniref:helix-turn-helix domain-containing protein n=1 Tax=Agrobacterium fabrum TaxID=1176649 RepID=UPI000EF60A7F|nr:helix-turn-helix domain-containing protein [Agrobacterium fabrum]AYM66122.1 hypothetical protein At12D13_49700 [Agrobacterium fabrum]NTE63969.1 hypothetical protein [Agrobacterium fabrum]